MSQSRLPPSGSALRPRSAEATAPTPAVFVCGLDGVIRLWSVGAERLYGMPASEVIGQKISHIAGSEVSAVDLRSLATLGRGALWSRRHPAVRPGVRSVVLSTFTVTDGPAGVGEIVVYSVEVGPTGMSEPSPQESAFIPSFEDELTILCDSNMAVTYVGPAYFSMFGLLARNLIGRDVRALLHPDDHSLWVKAWITALSQPTTVVPVNVRARRTAQSWRWLRQGILAKPTDRRIRGVVVISSGIADVVGGSGDSVGIAEQTLLAVLEASVEGVWLTDASGRGVFANARAAEILGLSVEDLLRRSLADVLGDTIANATRPLPVGNADPTPATSVAASRAGRRGEYELPYQRPDGGLGWIRLAVTPRFDPAGQSLGSIVTCAPLTERVSGRASGIERLLGSADPSGPSPSTASDGPDRVGSSGIAGPIFDEARSRALLMKAVPALSRRESEVVIRLILGDRVPTIARILFISQSTVRNHLASAFRKAGVSTQQELIQLVNSAA